jgi:cell division septal protein FtsQ
MEEKKNKKILIWLILGSAVLGIIFSILYLGFEIFIPAASAVSLSDVSLYYTCCEKIYGII